MTTKMNFRKKSTDEGRMWGTRLTEDSVKWPGFSISGVMIRQCYMFKS